MPGESQLPVFAQNRHQKPTIFLVEDDGTIRTWTVEVAVDATGRERPILVEAGRQQAMSLYGTNTAGDITGIENEITGELRTILMGWDGAAPIRALFEATGEQRFVPLATDEAGNLDAHRSDPNRVPWKRDYPGYVYVPPQTMPNAEGALWTPGVADTIHYEVNFIVVNVFGAVTGPVTVGQDIAAGGGLFLPEFWMYQEFLAWPGTSSWRGPFFMRGNDVIRGLDGGGANQSNIHFRVKRVDLGA